MSLTVAIMHNRSNGLRRSRRYCFGVAFSIKMESAPELLAAAYEGHTAHRLTNGIVRKNEVGGVTINPEMVMGHA
jgi:hypothetical protein